MLTIAGIGPGNPKYLTIEVLDAIKEVEYILAFGRVAKTFGKCGERFGEKSNISKVMPGLSSFQYLMAKLEKPWQEAKFISLHGRNGDLESVRDYRTSIILIDKDNNPNFISIELKRLNIKGIMYIGFDLSYDSEKIIKINIGEEVVDHSSLGVVVIENEMD